MTTAAATLTHLGCCAVHTGGSIPVWQVVALAVALGVRLVVSVRRFGAAWFDGIREPDTGVTFNPSDELDPAPPTTAGAEHEEFAPRWHPSSR